MRFYTRKRRQAPAVIIVALIDILIVLVIFLLVTTTFKQQPAMKLALPQSAHAQKSGASQKPPILVSVDATGALRFGPNATPVTPKELQADLAAAIAKDPAARLAINADLHAPWGQVVKVVDAAQGAGLKSQAMAFIKKTRRL